MIDLASLGAPRDGQVSDFAVAITASLGLPEQEIGSLVHEVLVRLADDFGFA